MAKNSKKRQFPYSTIKSRLYKEYKGTDFGGWRSEGLKTLTGQVYAEYKLGHLGKHKNAKRIPKKILLGSAKEFIPALESPDIEETTVPYWRCHEETIKLQSVLKDKADTTLVATNFAGNFFLSDYDYYTQYKAFVDHLNKLKVGSERVLVIKSEYNLKADRWIIRIVWQWEAGEEMEGWQGDEEGETEGWQGDEGGGGSLKKKPEIISDEDLEKLNKKERAKALGSDKKKELKESDAIIAKKITKVTSEFDKERATYIKLSKAKVKDDFLLDMLREKLKDIDSELKSLRSLRKSNTEKIKDIDKKIK